MPTSPLPCPPITGLAELALNVRDLPAMQRFYEQTLGFEVLVPDLDAARTASEPRDDDAPTFVFLTIQRLDTALGRHGHPLVLALIDAVRHDSIAGRFDPPEPRRSSLNHFALEIPLRSYEDHRRRLVALGLEPTEEQFPALRARALFFRDPEGNTIELIAHDPSAGEAGTD